VIAGFVLPNNERLSSIEIVCTSFCFWIRHLVAGFVGGQIRWIIWWEIKGKLLICDF
jgi:hypothetical protein